MPDSARPMPPNAASPAVVSAGLALDYRFAVDASLRALEAQLCFRGRVPTQLTSGLPGASGALRAAWAVEAGVRRELPIRAGRVELIGVPERGCVHYTIDLEHAEVSSSFAVVRRGRAVSTNIALWLWRPSTWAEPIDVTANFEVPSGLNVSVPWRADGERFRLDASAFAFYAYAAFGHFERESIEVAGAVLDVAVLPGLAPTTRTDVGVWLRHAAAAVAQAFGRFPRERAQVVVVPASERPGRDPDEDPVPFGTVTRGGGASAMLILAPNAGRDALLRDWVAVHEFAHLLHPFLRRQDAWLAEGLATYYQEVLRVRAGVHPEAAAWRRLHEGASLGRHVQVTLLEESAAMSRNHSYRAVYWAGAAFALLADAELRRASQGRFDLDQALAAISDRTAAQARPWSASELLAQLEAAAGAPVLRPLFQRWVEGSTWPDLEALLTGFGVDARARTYLRDEGAEEAWMGRAIMSGAQRRLAGSM